MKFLETIYLQYLLETALAVCLLLPWLKRKPPRRLLVVIAALNALRFGGAFAALAALHGSPAPAALFQVAIGDGLTACMAVAALVLLVRTSELGLRAATLMNCVGLVDILVSEAWLGHLELTGAITRTSILHGPTIGAALYSALHVVAFYSIDREYADRSGARLR